MDSKVTPVEAPNMGATSLASPFEESLARGYQALAAGDWVAARDAFAIASVSDSPEALDGLSRALWWLRQEKEAVVHRERAYAGFRREGRLAFKGAIAKHRNWDRATDPPAI